MLGGQSPAKAWVVFDGERNTGGTLDATNTNRQIIASYRVGSVSRTAAGTYTVNIEAGALPDANYCAVMSSVGQGLASRNATFSHTATQLGVTTRSVSAPGTLIDVARVDVAIFD